MGDQQLVSNPHDVAVTRHDGFKEPLVIVANLKPSEIWLFKDDQAWPMQKNNAPGAPGDRSGKTLPAPAAAVHLGTAEAIPKVLSSHELPKVTKAPSEDTPLWKSFGLIVVFVTGLAMIFYYLRKCIISLFFKPYFYLFLSERKTGQILGSPCEKKRSFFLFRGILL